ncbi:hypothetical protein SUGI_0096050 [Cryptomeria japonica]|nr:hypothetical protein SUGI_0096050 [Cryptomeria japonica]
MGVETMQEIKEVVETVLLPLQLSLGIFLIMKTTPLWAVVHCTLAYLLHCSHFPYTDSKQPQGFDGRIFKKVVSHAITAGNVSKVKKEKDTDNLMNAKFENGRSVSVNYLGKKFVLERMEGNEMLMKNGPTYYITDKMWETVQYIGK